jgi:hypothetical protein
VNVAGNNIDNLIGEISLNNTIYKEGTARYSFDVLSLVSEVKNNKKSLTLLSDFAEADMTGNFKILELPVSLEKLMSNYLPEYFDGKAQYQNLSPQIFNYEVVFKNTDALTRLFIPALTIAPLTRIAGEFNSTTNSLELQGKSANIKIGNMILKNWNTQISANNKLLFNVGCESFYLTDSTFFKAFNVNGTAKRDTVNWDVTWNNNTVLQNKGDIKGSVRFETNNMIKLMILPSQLVFEDSLWNIAMEKEASIDTSFFSISKLSFQHNNQSMTNLKYRSTILIWLILTLLQLRLV